MRYISNTLLYVEEYTDNKNINMLIYILQLSMFDYQYSINDDAIYIWILIYLDILLNIFSQSSSK